jgi:hypothetical protein
VLGRLAFSAAADPRQFPEQFVYGVQPWQATRILLNTFRFGTVNTTSEDQMKIDVGGYNSLEGKSYGEIAADSRSQHRSQGFGVPHTRGSFLEYFSAVGGEKADSSIMQNINCSWDRFPNSNGIGSQISQIIKNYDPSAPYMSLQKLVKLYKSMGDLPAGYWREEKQKETLELIRACSGIWLEATVPEGYAVRNQNITVTIRAVNRSPVSITLQSVTLNGQDTIWNQLLNPGTNYSLLRSISLRGLPVSQPYWLDEPMSPGSYNVEDQKLIGRPQNPPVLEAVFNIGLYGENFNIRQLVSYKYTDAVKGEIFEPLTIVPAQMATLVPDLLVFKKGDQKLITIKEQIKTAFAADDEGSGITQTNLSMGKNFPPNTSSVSITSVPGFEMKRLPVADRSVSFILKSELSTDKNTATWATQIITGNYDTLLQCRTISYEHIPRIDYFKPVKSVLVAVNLKTAGKRIGYIEGAGDKVPEALTAMGYTVIKLNEGDVSPAGLQNLDAVITGLRAYDVHDWLKGKYPVLMDYLKKGGNLIVQYNRNMGTDTTGIGPYSFGISNIRVTEEDAPVQILQPAHPVFLFPNKITNSDFDGWIQERGIYFANKIDPRYQTVLSMHDTGEPDQFGSLIIGKYGKGSFTYTGLVFFRELPAGVPGAYRLLANIIALNQQKNK